MAPERAESVEIGTQPLARTDVVAVARHGAPVILAEQTLVAMASSRDHIDRLADGTTPVYGVSTGFGALATRHILPADRAQLQRSLVRSHAASTGAEVERETIRGMMVLRLRTLATGRTGVRPSTARALADLLNAGITPVVGEFGSLGCSGDLAPLAHVALALTGEGDVRDASGANRAAADALAAAGLTPIELREKEGLALINGTDGMLSMLLLADVDIAALLTVADIAAAMSIEAVGGTDAAMRENLIALRPQPGQQLAAQNIRAMLAKSTMVRTAQTLHSERRVQDAYSLRCAPQVAGAVRDTAAHARLVAERELAATIDNPVVLADGTVASNGNFHGAPLGYALDFLAIALADLASIAERRTDRLLDAGRSHGLPAFLAESPGVDSGLMIAHYTQAGMVAELKRLAVPASVDSLPTSAMQEDHVSLGWSAGRKLCRVVDVLARVLAIELMTAARALELRTRLSGAPASPASSAAIAAVRQHVAGPGPDRYLSPEIDAATAAVRDGTITAAVEAVTGPLE